eukprot:2005776-Rhodomonas_salina.2
MSAVSFPAPKACRGQTRMTRIPGTGRRKALSVWDTNRSSMVTSYDVLRIGNGECMKKEIAKIESWSQLQSLSGHCAGTGQEAWLDGDRLWKLNRGLHCSWPALTCTESSTQAILFL